MEERIVIVGAGQAGGELATGLRKQGYTGRPRLDGRVEVAAPAAV